MSKFRFAIMGAGGIAVKFCDAIAGIENGAVTAIASKSAERAEAFAERHGIAAAYGDYEEMLAAEKPDCVYIAVTPNDHFRLSMLCLDYRVPVLCEKAMFMSGSEAKTFFERAARERVFAMEAMWSRFLPAIRQAKQWLNEGRIGTSALAEAAIGFVAPADPDNRYFNPKLGGGAAYDLTVYAYELISYLFGREEPKIQVAVMRGPTGVDVANHAVLRYPELIASLTTSLVAPLEEKLVVYGDKGKIVVPHPHYADEAFLFAVDDRESLHYRDTETTNGFVYQIREAMACIASGRIESRVVPHGTTIRCAELFDRIAEQR